ncbi:hypothetical protein OAN61_00230 [bacterium]|nr:hypothetical protein [bacterium]
MASVNIPIFASSRDGEVVNKGKNSHFVQRLTPALQLPIGVKNPRMYLEQASLTYSMTNVDETCDTVALYMTHGAEPEWANSHTDMTAAHEHHYVYSLYSAHQHNIAPTQSHAAAASAGAHSAASKKTHFLGAWVMLNTTAKFVKIQIDTAVGSGTPGNIPTSSHLTMATMGAFLLGAKLGDFYGIQLGRKKSIKCSQYFFRLGAFLLGAKKLPVKNAPVKNAPVAPLLENTKILPVNPPSKSSFF